MQFPRIDPKNTLGLADKIVGLGKEIAGSVAGHSGLEKSGQAQQEKGTERIKAIKAQVAAQQHEARAEAAEKAQKSAEKVSG